MQISTDKTSDRKRDAPLDALILAAFPSFALGGEEEVAKVAPLLGKMGC